MKFKYLTEDADKVWLVSIILNDNSEKGLKISANSYDEANKVAEQYIRIKQQESTIWENASVETISPIES